MRSVLIVEDNEKAMESLRKIAVSLNAIVYTADNSADAYRIACQHNIDIFLVDIILNPQIQGDVSGSKFVLDIKEMPRYARAIVIFITSREDFQNSAYSQLHCYSFIEKPFYPEYVRTILKEAMQLPQFEIKTKEKICFQMKDKPHVVRKISEIIYIQKQNNRITVYSIDGAVDIQYRTINAVMEELDSPQFLKCNRNTLVNTDYVDIVDPINRYITLRNNYGCLEIGSKLKKRFMEELHNG